MRLTIPAIAAPSLPDFVCAEWGGGCVFLLGAALAAAVASKPDGALVDDMHKVARMLPLL